MTWYLGCRTHLLMCLTTADIEHSLISCLSVCLSEMVFRWHHDQVVGDMADEARDSRVSSGKRVGWMVGNHRHWETTQILCPLSSFKAGGPSRSWRYPGSIGWRRHTSSGWGNSSCSSTRASKCGGKPRSYLLRLVASRHCGETLGMPMWSRNQPARAR